MTIQSIRLLRLRWVYLYISLIPIVNMAFVYTPTLAMPDGGQWSPMAIITGLVLVVRDFAQREIGHWIFVPLLIAVGLSYAMAGPEIALASGAAFLVSEMVDWAVYTFTHKPLSTRVMISSVAGAPVDTLVFLMGANLIVPGILAPSTLITSIASKLFGAYVVFRLLRRREQQENSKN